LRRADNLLHVHIAEAGLLRALEQEVGDGVVQREANPKEIPVFLTLRGKTLRGKTLRGKK
jgi:hypothetical protein